MYLYHKTFVYKTFSDISAFQCIKKKQKSALHIRDDFYPLESFLQFENFIYLSIYLSSLHMCIKFQQNQNFSEFARFCFVTPIKSDAPNRNLQNFHVTNWLIQQSLLIKRILTIFAMQTEFEFKLIRIQKLEHVRTNCYQSTLTWFRSRSAAAK